MSANDDYREIKARIKDLRDAKSKIPHTLQDELDALLIARWKELNPRKKKVPDIYSIRQQVSDFYQTKFDEFVARMNEMNATLDAEIETLNSSLKELLPQIEIVASDTDFVLDTSSAYSYHTQGWGANRYAHGWLGYQCELLNANGFTARIDCEERPGSNLNTYHLIANCEPCVWDALWALKGDAYDWERWQWKNGVNPKVYTGGYSLTESDGTLSRR